MIKTTFIYLFLGIFDYSSWLEKPPSLVIFKEPYTSVTANSYESAPNTAGLLKFIGFYKGALSFSQILQNYHSSPRSVCYVCCVCFICYICYICYTCYICVICYIYYMCYICHICYMYYV
jgi:hypothetical protein